MEKKETGIRAFLAAFQKKHPTLYQFLGSWLMGGVATVVDLALFALLNYLVFRRYAAIGIRWWLFDYSVQNGGLCALLSFALSFAAAQAINFILQRKAIFAATNNAAASAVGYAVMVVLVYLFVLWLPSVISEPIYRTLGAAIGAIVVKLLSELVSFLIQFPLNKFVIMRKR